MGIFIILVSTGAGFTLPALRMNRLGGNVTDATFYATEGLEAAKSIRNQGWTTPFLATTCSGGCGISSGGGFWAWNGVNNTKAPYTRTITVASVGRDGSGNILSSGGTDDPNTKKVTSTVNWNFIAARPETVSLVAYVTNWAKSILGNWATPAIDGCVNLAGNTSAVSVAVSGNYAYVVTSANNFVVVDISNPTVPTVAATLAVSGTPTGVVVSGNYAYISSSSNTAELIIVNITTPTAPSIAGTLDLSGNTNAMDVAVSGNYAYIIRTSVAGNFAAVNVTNKAAPVVAGTVTLAGNANKIVILGNYAYVATSDNASELRVVNITTPGTPVLAGLLNLSGTSDGISITGASSIVYVAQAGGTMNAISVATPATPTLISTFATTQQVNGMSLGNSDTYLFTAKAVGTSEFQVLNVTTPASMTSLGVLNMTSAGNDVQYVSGIDRAVIGTANNVAEVCVIKPQ